MVSGWGCSMNINSIACPAKRNTISNKYHFTETRMNVNCEVFVKAWGEERIDWMWRGGRDRMKLV